MTSADVDKVYIERIKPRLIEGTPTEDIRRWSVSAHSVMEVTGPSPFGENGNVLLWLHEKSLTQLFDMCDAVDERFSEIEQAATLGNGTCEMYRDDFGEWNCIACENGADKITGSDGKLDSWNDSWPPNYCPYCGAKVIKTT